MRSLALLAIATVLFGAGAAPQKDRLPAKEVVSRLDAHFQAVLQDIELTKPKKVLVKGLDGKEHWVERGSFGSSRIVPRVPGHGEFFAEGKDKTLEARAKGAVKGWREWVFLVGNGRKAIDLKALRTTRTHGWGAILPTVKQYPTDQAAEKLAAEVLRTSKSRQDTIRGAWHWAASKVVFKNKECLSCHTDSKIGDVAGILVYALHEDPTRK